MRRQGRMTHAQSRAMDALWAQYGLEAGRDCLEDPQKDYILEIGFGMGGSLLSMAKAHPEQNFIGVEVHRPGVGKLLSEIEKYQLNNIRIFQNDIINVLNQSIKDNILCKTQIFFPDPWPKRRHHKRRLVQADFIQKLYQKLKPGGYLHLATDWKDYAEQMMAVMTQAEGFINCSGTNKYIENQIIRPITKFEQRGRQLGHSVWDLLFQKKE